MNNSVSAVKNRGPVRWSLRLLGGFELCVHPGGEKVTLPGKRERALLAYLALSPKSRQPRRKLAALIWGDATDQTLLDNLRTCIWRLRKALGDMEHRLLASDDEDIVLDSAAFNVDVLIFRCFAARSERSALEAAAKQYIGEFLDGLELDSEEFEFWRRAEASRCRDQAIDVLSRLMRLFMEGAEFERAIETGAMILRFEPLHEATARHLMKLYAENGRRGAAIQIYHNLAEVLRTDVDAQPEAETRLVFAGIARAGEGQYPARQAGASPERQGQPILPPAKRPAFGMGIPLAVLAALLMIAAALVSYWWPAPGPIAATGSRRQITAAAPVVQAESITIAVLPFDNLSGDAGQQFFSDGMTEEITGALAKVPGLKLIARASAFALRNDKDAQNVGTRLGARYVIGGTVRKIQNRVRITARLVRTDSGASVWSESYERALTDVFAIQEDIATAIAEALSMSLGLPPGKHLVASRSIDPQDYEKFLRAKPLVRARLTGVPQAIKILEPLVKRNPNYAPAWALLADCYAMMPGLVPPYNAERRRRMEAYGPKAEEAAHWAMRLDPNLADSYLSLIRVEEFRGNWGGAEDLDAKALERDPDNPDALALLVEIYANVGYRKKALAIAQQLRALEPYVPTWKEDAAEVMWENGQSDAAIEMMKSLLDRPSGATSLAMMYASVGRYTEAADVLKTALKTPEKVQPQWLAMFPMAVDILRTVPAQPVLPSDPPRLDRVSFVYLYTGMPEHALDYDEAIFKSGVISQGILFSYLWHASYAPARRTERFKSFVREAGFVDYWRQRGWPESCHPLTADDFECT